MTRENPGPPPPGAAVDLVVPGSAANLGPGFDSMGLALGILDRYRATVTAEPGLRLDLGEDAQGVPQDERHLVIASMYRAWDLRGVPRPAGLELVCRNTIRMGRGMGSSAAAIVAGTALADALTREEARDASPGEQVPLDLTFVNDLSSLVEGHPDNASASVFGGVTLSFVEDGAAERHTSDAEGSGPLPHVRTISLPVHPDIEPVLFVPQTQLPTSTARAVLPAHVPHGEAALNGARAAVLVHALGHDPSLLAAGTREWLHQEQRRAAYPDAMDLVDALRGDGHAAFVSGAGPSVLVLAEREQAAALRTPDGLEGAWRLLRPGIPAVGVQAVRATLEASLPEHTG